MLLCTDRRRDGAWRSPAPRQGKARPCLRHCRWRRGRAFAHPRLLLPLAAGSALRRTIRCDGCRGWGGGACDFSLPLRERRWVGIVAVECVVLSDGEERGACAG